MPKKDATAAGCKSTSKKKGHKPAHLNTFAFQHNANSKTTKKILALPVEGLCRRCTEKIEWRKRYRKYKPLTKPAVCVYCKKKDVKAAYHKCCSSCAQEKGQCPFCVLTWEEIAAAEAEYAGSARSNTATESCVLDLEMGDSHLVQGSRVESDEDSGDSDDDEASEHTEGYVPWDGGVQKEREAEAKRLAKLAANGGVDWSKYVQKRQTQVVPSSSSSEGSSIGKMPHAPLLCLEVRSPFAAALLTGRKTVEVRKYPLPPTLLHHPLQILETRYEELTSAPPSATAEAQASPPQPPPTPLVGLPSFVPEGSNPKGGPRTNWEGWKFGDARTLPAMALVKSHAVCFSRCVAYESRAAFEADRPKHLIQPGSAFDSWRSPLLQREGGGGGGGASEVDDGPLYAWEVGGVVALPHEGEDTDVGGERDPSVGNVARGPTEEAAPSPAPAEGAPPPDSKEASDQAAVFWEVEQRLPCLQRRLRSIFDVSWPSREVSTTTANSNNPFASERTLKAEAKALRLATAQAAARASGGSAVVAAEYEAASTRASNVHGRAPVVVVAK